MSNNNWFTTSVIKMKFRSDKNRQEKGFVLVLALLVMLVLTIIGIAATTNTSLELRIAGNDKLHKETFYAAEGGAILGTETLEQNLNCVTGFEVEAGQSYALLEDIIKVETTDFAYNTYSDSKYSSDTQIAATLLDDSQADFIYPEDSEQQSFGYVVGETQLQAGGSPVMNAGYERKGKSAASGGVSLLYDVYARHDGVAGSESIVLFGWRHLVGDESTCRY